MEFCPALYYLDLITRVDLTETVRRRYVTVPGHFTLSKTVLAAISSVECIA